MVQTIMRKGRTGQERCAEARVLSQVSSKVLRCFQVEERPAEILRCFDSGSALQTVAFPYRISISPADSMKDQKFIVVRWRMSAFGLSSWSSDYVTYNKEIQESVCFQPPTLASSSLLNRGHALRDGVFQIILAVASINERRLRSTNSRMIFTLPPHDRTQTDCTADRPSSTRWIRKMKPMVLCEPCSSR
jgi:hypothetical protein